MVTVKSIIDVLALTYIEEHNPLADFPLLFINNLIEITKKLIRINPKTNLLVFMFKADK